MTASSSTRVFLFAALALAAQAVTLGADDLCGLQHFAQSLLACQSAPGSCDDFTACDSCDGPAFHVTRCCSRFKLTEFNIYPTFSYLKDDSATYNEFEFASITDLGWLEMENRTILNVADLPGTIKIGPQNPTTGLPATQDIRSSGFGDILSGFFFSTRGAHEKKTHLGLGPVWTFPTASSGLLGSEQYTVGPGAHFSTECERMTLGFFLWQSWGFGRDSSVKQVNQLNGKPFIIYELTEKLHAIYIPLGLSHSWEGKGGDDWTVPVGGGLRRLFEVHGQQMGFQMQAFFATGTCFPSRLDVEPIRLSVVCWRRFKRVHSMVNKRRPPLKPIGATQMRVAHRLRVKTTQPGFISAERDGDFGQHDFSNVILDGCLIAPILV